MRRDLPHALAVIIAFGGLSCRKADLTSPPPLRAVSTSPTPAPSPTSSSRSSPRGTSAEGGLAVKTPTRQVGCDQLGAVASDLKPIGPELDLAVLFEQAESGNHKLARVLAEHPDSPGGDPDLLLRAGGSAMPSYLVFPAGVLRASNYRRSPRQGLTVYEVVGRFSGRVIDYYEWYRSQNRKEVDRASVGENAYLGYSNAWTEFCVQSWCFVPDPAPDAGWPPDQRAEIRNAYAEHVRLMKADGAKVCSGVRHPKQHHVGK